MDHTMLADDGCPAPHTTRRGARRALALPRALAPLRALALALAAGLAATGLTLVTAGTAAAALPAVPRVNDGRVVAVTVVAGKVYVAGSFTSITLQNGSTIARAGLFSYDLVSGAYNTAFAPAIGGGGIAALSPTPDGTGLLIGGSFATVNGLTQRRLARLNTNGTLNTTFRPAVDAAVTAIAVTGTRVFAGGYFNTVGGVSRAKLAEVNPLTGALVPGFNLPIGGNAAVGGFVTVQALDISPDRSRLVVAHNGATVAGQDRYGVAVIDLGTAAGTATLNPWFTDLWQDNLFRNGGVVRVTDVAWGPTGTWFVTTNTGGDRPPTNDCVQRFDVTGPGPVAPTWVTRQFDSSYAVDIGRDGSIYTGGHFRFTEAPGSTEPWPGEDNVNYGFGPAGGAAVLGAEVVERGQLDALDPATGKARNWYHTANGQHGITELLVVGDALLIGQDGALVDGRTVGRHGMVPTITAPADLSRPLTTVAEPLMGAVLPVGPTLVSGRATAPGGVRSVSVEVKRGSQWVRADGSLSPTFVALPAALTSPNATATDWSLTVALPSAGGYQLFPRATDRAGVREPVRYAIPVTMVDLTNAPPAVTITSPTSNQQDFTSNTITVSGTATDPDGVAAVSVSFFNETRQGYVQANGTLGDFVSFPAVLGAAAGSTRPWSFTLTIPDGEYNLFVGAVDTRGASLARSISRGFVMSPNNAAPVTTITSPTTGSAIDGTLTITGTATDDTAVRRVLVRMADGRFNLGPQVGGGFGAPGMIPAVLASPNATSTTWSLTVTGLPVGSYAITAYAEDSAGVSTAALDRPTVSGLQQRPAGSVTPEPATTITGPNPSTFRATAASIPLTGTASYGGGVAAVRVVARDLLSGRYLQPDGSTAGAIALLRRPVTSPASTSTGWQVDLALPESSQWQVDVLAEGEDGNLDWSSAGGRSTFLVYPGDADPTIEWNSPADGTVITGGQLSAGGRAFDDVGVAAVQVMIRRADDVSTGLRADGSLGSPQWLTAFITNPNGTFTNWNYLSPVLPAGSWQVLARSVDSVGKPMLTPPQRTVILT